MKYLEKFELQKLLEVAKETSPIDYLFILLTFNHGLRVSETISLTADNFKGDCLVIQRLKGSCRTDQPLLPNEAELLKTVTPGASGRYFPFDRTTAWRHMKRIGTLAGIDPRRCFCHALKHTTAMMGLEGGMKINELQKYLGHRSGQSTMKYLEVSEEKASKAFAAAVGGL